MTPRDLATEVVRTLRAAGHEALFVGGCVRDQILGHPPVDYDVATAAEPDVVRKLFRRTVAVGVAFGVVEVLGPDKLKVQVATFRSDGPYTDGRRPDAVWFGSAAEDAIRRDFTINGIFYDPIDDRLIDHVGGARDLRDRLLRAIGDPAARFREDRLRLLRAVRFAARFELTIEPATRAAVIAMAAQVTEVSGERIAEELRKMLIDRHRHRAARLMEETNLLKAVLPEVGTLTNETELALLELGDAASFELAFAVLLGHVAATNCKAIAARLRLANAERDRIAWLLENREALAAPERLPQHRLKPLLAHPGRDELLELHRVHGHAGAVAWCELKLREWPPEVLDPPTLVTGDDLKALGVPPGPEYKRLLDLVRNEQLDDALVTRDAALARLARAAGR